MEHFFDLIKIPGAAVVAGTMLGLILVRKGLLTIIGDKRDAGQHNVYAEIINNLRAEIIRLHAAVQQERDDCNAQIAVLRSEIAGLYEIVKMRRKPR